MLALKLVDFHKMLELLEDDGEPVCDFGVFLVQEESEVGELRTGDLVISVLYCTVLYCTVLYRWGS